MTKKYPHYTPYSFSGNIVINARELEGLEPGVLFSTVESAAKNFAMTYNDNSIKDKKEYGSVIYKTSDFRGRTMYSYTVPTVAQEDGVIIMPDFSKSMIIVAGVHAHSNYSIKYDNDIFSGADKRGAEFTRLDAYVSTPKGEFLLYNPQTDESKTYKSKVVATDIPADKNHPDFAKRKIKIDSSLFPKNEPTRDSKTVIYDNTAKPFEDAIHETIQTVKQALTVPSSLTSP